MFTTDTIITGLLVGGVAATTVAPLIVGVVENDGRDFSFTGVNAISPVTVCPHSKYLEETYLTLLHAR